MIHHLRTFTIGEFVKCLLTLAAFFAGVYAGFLIAWAHTLPEMPQ